MRAVALPSILIGQIICDPWVSALMVTEVRNTGALRRGHIILRCPSSLAWLVCCRPWSDRSCCCELALTPAFRCWPRWFICKWVVLKPQRGPAWTFLTALETGAVYRRGVRIKLSRVNTFGSKETQVKDHSWHVVSVACWVISSLNHSFMIRYSNPHQWFFSIECRQLFQLIFPDKARLWWHILLGYALLA